MPALVTGSLYAHAYDENRFLFVREGKPFPAADFLRRYWTLVVNGLETNDEQIISDLGSRAWTEVRRPPKEMNLMSSPQKPPSP